KMAFPFKEGENPLVVVHRLLNGPRPQLTRARDTLAPEIASQLDLIETLEGAIVRALSSDPAVRPDTTTAFWGDVEPALRAAIDRKAARVDAFQATEPAGVGASGARERAPRGGPPAGTAPRQATPAHARAPLSSGPPRAPSQKMRAVEPAAANPIAW